MVELKHIFKSFKSKHVIVNMNFKLTEPEIIAVVGNNGAGKTTLFNILMGYIKPTSGEALLNGVNPRKSENISAILIDEKMCYLGSNRLDKIIETHAIFDKKFDKQKCLQVMDMFKLQPKLYYNKLSKGMKNQFNIAIGFASAKDILLFDEPTSGLDEISRYNFYKFLNKDFINNPRLILISTHTLEELENLASKLLVIKDDGEYLLEQTEDIASIFVSVTGDAQGVDLLTADRWLCEAKSLGNIKSCIIENRLSYQDKKSIKFYGLEHLPVKAHEACRIICNNSLFEVSHE